MQLKELKSTLEGKLSKNLPTSAFLSKMRVIDEDSRKSAAFNDPNYIPFYYWLGLFVTPKNVLELGFRLGLFSGNLVKSCKSIEHLAGFQHQTDEYYNMRLGRANVRDNYSGILEIFEGDFTDFSSLAAQHKWDLAIINEEFGYDIHRDYLDVIWPNLSSEGLIVMDYITRHKPARDAFLDFCKIKNCKFVEVKTRYGVGIIER